jgi:hypothetical protein
MKIGTLSNVFAGLKSQIPFHSTKQWRHKLSGAGAYAIK